MMDSKKLFFYQTIQDTVALYYRLPIRQFAFSSNQKIFSYCKEIKFLNLDYESKESFVDSLEILIQTVPNFFEKNLKQSLQLKNLEDINYEEIEKLKEYLTFTRSSFSPFFIRALNESKSITVLKMAFHIYLLFSSDGYDKYYFRELTFFNYTYKVYHDGNTLFVLGPIMIDKGFDSDERKLSYIKNIKDFFELQLHAHELVNLINQRNRFAVNKFDEKAQSMIKVLLMKQKSFDENYEYKKQELREIASDFIIKNIDDKNREYVTTRIKNNQILRDLEGLEWFNDLSFNYLSFGTSSEKHSNNALDFLQIKLQADAYILCNYNHAQEQIIVDECNISDKALKEKLSQSIEKSNKNGGSIKNSFTYEVILDYLKDNVPIKLVEDMSKSEHKLCNADSKIGSLLSIPLVFDQRVFAVLHFMGYEKFKFDEIDKRFLLKLSSIFSKQHIEKRFNKNSEKIVTLLEGLHKTIDYNYLQQRTDEICKNIAKVFSSDGAIIWFNKKEIFQTPRETDELSILSQINFLDEKDSQDDRYPIFLNKDESLIKKHLHKELTAIDDIRIKCTDDQEDILFMKYRKQFISKGIISIMFVPIQNYDGKFSGAVMIFDKLKRDYNQLSKRMMKRTTLHIGAVLNTVTYATYRTKRLDEKNLHESSQYLNIIDSRAKDLEWILKKMYLSDKYEKRKLFLNVEDIKDFVGFTRNFLLSLFAGGEFVITKYDELIEKGIMAIRENKEYISIRKSLNQVLIVHQEEMNQIKDIIYDNKVTQNIALKIPKQQFHDILNNMINNAIKYGKLGTYIKISDEYNPPYHYNIYIENIGHNIDVIEKDRIFQKGVRGQVTKEHLADNEDFKESDSTNKGLGLFFTKELMKRGLKGNVKLYKSNPIHQTGYSKHVFVLKIPIKMTKEI